MTKNHYFVFCSYIIRLLWFLFLIFIHSIHLFLLFIYFIHASGLSNTWNPGNTTTAKNMYNLNLTIKELSVHSQTNKRLRLSVGVEILLEEPGISLAVMGHKAC